VSAVTVRHFTDPACLPNPEWLRLRWQYGDRVRWELRMVVLREHRGEGWPHERGSDATVHACRAVVAAGLRWPARQEPFLRHLAVLSAEGEMLDDSDTLEIAAERAGLPVAEIAAYCAEPEVEAALRAQMRAADCGTLEIDGSLDDLPRRPDPRSIQEVLAWARMPVTAAEVAELAKNLGSPPEKTSVDALDGPWLPSGA
jgi:hypothetical protein